MLMNTVKSYNADNYARLDSANCRCTRFDCNVNSHKIFVITFTTHWYVNIQIVQLGFIECSFSIKRYEYKKSRIYALSVEPNCILDYGCRNSIMARV